MENQNKKTRRTADQILFAEQEKFEQKKRNLRAFEKLLTRFDKISSEIIQTRDELEAAGMARAEIIDAFQLDPIAAKLVKTTSKKNAPATSESAPAPSSVPASGSNWQEDN